MRALTVAAAVLVVSLGGVLGVIAMLPESTGGVGGPLPSGVVCGLTIHDGRVVHVEHETRWDGHTMWCE